ncbi:MAG: Fic family protein [Lachnospiraceae bacterium]|nr:Fic family protein [Lachnospiraceae bacterium]
MSDVYKPPFTMTDNITNLIIEVGELTGRITVNDELSINPKLRRENRIKTIHSSLAIEQNIMSLAQVSDVLDGKRVLAPPQDIREVKNAYEAYEELQRMNLYSIKDLLKAHKFMMNGLIPEAGTFRSKGVGVYAGEQLIHAGTPAQYVPELMRELFDWLKTSKLHPLVKSCIFHYEFEFIHPFMDGNGRVGRLWHSLILQKWKSFFAWLPVETLIYENQTEYYRVLNQSNTNGESTAFVEFMLQMIRDALYEIIKGQEDKEELSSNINDGINGSINDGIKVMNKNIESKILLLLQDNPYMTAENLADILRKSKRQVERKLSALKAEGKLERIGANKNGYWNVIKK